MKLVLNEKETEMKKVLIVIVFIAVIILGFSTPALAQTDQHRYHEMVERSCVAFANVPSEESWLAAFNRCMRLHQF